MKMAVNVSHRRLTFTDSVKRYYNTMTNFR
jgi:hypothetical protein